MNRVRLYLYGTGNIVGSLLALAALGLFFAGVIHAFWWLIVAGLYLAPVLAWPRSNLARMAETIDLQPELPAELLMQQLRRLADSVASGLPADSRDCLRSIQSTITELLPRLKEMRERGSISAKDSFAVIETVRRYLPDTLSAYLRLPKLYAQMQPLADGRTASQTLYMQLRMLDGSLKDVAQSAFAGDAERLVRNGQFLQNKFAEKPAFRA